ncbi:YidC/Oxa1 family membrane protein insertase [Carnobacterium iners]|uniref:Membrane protein insertase YidC n=1 Tax=Carnobacterium iners TaxID=1073423 RepID=A0A1X7NT14_9LACT|nr:membrane protein insertase YidC [Carnobacterium iners]SEL16724.1 YidC/Oxa1 family membrane protein insertase [Carnobacterium iners]SMH40515.1 YidC/Oxa1 family membrane protein insertase [Carnobacterium iners]
MKKLNKYLLTGSLLSVMLFLSGCMSTDKQGNPEGFIYEFLVVPTQNLILWLADTFNGSYGFAIIIITLIVRVIILPLNLSQSRKSLAQQERTAVIKPELDVIQAKQKAATTSEEKATAQQELMSLYKENNMSMLGGIGCLPLLIQMPIFTAMFQAIRLSGPIAASTFLGINLGTRNIPLAIGAGLIYLVQAYVSMIGISPEQKKQMKTMMYMNPIMILMFTISSPAGLGLYWLVGGFFGVFQTILTNFYYKPRIQAEIAEEMKNRPKKERVIKQAEPIQEQPKELMSEKVSVRPSNDSSGRNSGKQQRK